MGLPSPQTGGGGGTTVSDKRQKQEVIGTWTVRAPLGGISTSSWLCLCRIVVRRGGNGNSVGQPNSFANAADGLNTCKRDEALI